ncbi:T6SS immunity protein Tli4 family protein [Massilia solisilvae]|uniref:T6SS immunity protein Tli4 family protein n=1 Tax=Massilia solisilvae TaxID=1811225 RepID=A0ABT2BMM0_9BURK|nr:T6SS immunity protein Tli4 family protein [Massilia solisilvae]MCS0609712.1 T6SS immunity protein Tli4 family protein [Massilia solisilvae]
MKRRSGFLLPLQVLLGVAFFLMADVLAMQGIHDRYRVAKMTEKMKTFCLGRFLIDLPANATVSYGPAFIDGFHLWTRLEDDGEFTRRVAARETEIAGQMNKLGKKNLELVKTYRSGAFNGKMFVFGRWRADWTENAKERHVEAVAVEGFLHGDGVSFHFSTENYDPALAGAMLKLFEKIAVRGDDELPARPGFCVGHAIVQDPHHDPTERATLFAGLPGHPDLAIVFDSTAGVKPSRPLLARNAAANESLPLLMRLPVRTLREGGRVINGLRGEELVEKATELNFATTFSFEWEMFGKEDDVHAPLLNLELQTGLNPHAGGKPVQSSLTESALVQLWDKISASVRLRPTTPIPVAPTPAPGAQLGTNARAGETCPQSGWWQCSEGGNGVRVLGGQRQYLKKGQRMPQALLLPPPTVWEKVRGIQPSFEASTPTIWKLADRRTASRAQASPHLEQAEVPRADALQTGGVPPAGAGANTPPGTYVKTGEPCPASGWWRCEESAALDGTRWFASGTLLPAATFQLPTGVFAKQAASPPIIRRRSNWQLLRHADAPGDVPGAGPGEPGGPGSKT